MRLALISLAILFTPLSLRMACGANPVTWQVALSTTGDDVFWTSPTAIDLGYPEYDWSYEITKLNANVFLLGNRDLLGELETTSGAGTGNTLPIVVVDDVLNESFTGSSAHIRIEVDAQGIGRGSGTDIALGTVLGLPIRRVDFEATIRVIGIPTGDYDRNGAVQLPDYHLWKNALGSTTELAADGNRNGVVDAADYTLWRDNAATEGMASEFEAYAVPEPAALLLIFGSLMLSVPRGWLSGRKLVRIS